MIRIREEINEINTKKIGKINDSKCWFFENINKSKTFTESPQEKKKRTQINKIRNERKEIPANTTETQRIIKVYKAYFYVKKLDNLEEMDKLLEMYNLPRMNNGEIENRKRPMTQNEIESVI